MMLLDSPSATQRKLRSHEQFNMFNEVITIPSNTHSCPVDSVFHSISCSICAFHHQIINLIG